MKSILDNDLYKFTVSYSYMKLFPEAEGTFTFVDRNNTNYTKEFLDNLKLSLSELSYLSLRGDKNTVGSEFKFVCDNIRFIPEYYWEWLKGFKFDYNKIDVGLDSNNHLHIEVTDKLYKVTLYEVPILAIVSELYSKMMGYSADEQYVLDKLEQKIRLSNQNKLYFSEFGTRRRFNYHIQNLVCEYLKRNALYCSGTSNVHMAHIHNMKPLGTHPHEWFMFHGAIYGYKQANYLALENWVNVYDGDLGIALSDTFTTDVFLKNLSRKHAKLFDGVRHDSGDPYIFVNKVINRYKELGVDPKSKTIIFSNALDFPTYDDLSDYCNGRIRCSAGIGTNLTNDCGSKPANIVMKLTACRISSRDNWKTTVKLSDDIGKHLGYNKEIEMCKYELGI